jgi:hypothetical protein
MEIEKIKFLFFVSSLILFRKKIKNKIKLEKKKLLHYK